MEKRKISNSVPNGRKGEKEIKLSMPSDTPSKSRMGNPRYNHNPFLDGFKIRIKNKKVLISDDQSVVDRSGNVIAPAGIHRNLAYDLEEHIKMYVNCGFTAFSNMSKNATRIFWLLLVKIQESAIGKDIVNFTFHIASKLNIDLNNKQLTKAIYYKGIQELIDKDIIAESSDGAGNFYINPRFFFNGDRYQFVRKMQDLYKNK